MREEIRKLLLELRLKGMEQHLDTILDQAEQTGQAPAEVVVRLLKEEYRYRQERSFQYRLKQAKLPWDWTLDTFPFDHQPGVQAHQIRALGDLGFVGRAQNIVFIGPPGTGKTGLALGLLRQALINGYRGRFYNAQDLIDELYASLADSSTTRVLNRSSAYDLLVIDELGYLTLKPEQVNAFFKLLDQRYGRTSTLITTNPMGAKFGWIYEIADFCGGISSNSFGRWGILNTSAIRFGYFCVTFCASAKALRT
jgi:DNA replication protein DnaC